MLSHLFGKKDSQCITSRRLKQSVKNEAKVIQQKVNKKITWTINLTRYQMISNEKDLVRITSKIITVLNTYGFRRTKFIPNLPTVLKSLLSSEILPTFVYLDLGSYACERTLGLIWNINTDKLSFKPVTKKTKRNKTRYLEHDL